MMTPRHALAWLKIGLPILSLIWIIGCAELEIEPSPVVVNPPKVVVTNFIQVPDLPQPVITNVVKLDATNFPILVVTNTNQTTLSIPQPLSVTISNWPSSFTNHCILVFGTNAISVLKSEVKHIEEIGRLKFTESILKFLGPLIVTMVSFGIWCYKIRRNQPEKRDWYFLAGALAIIVVAYFCFGRSPANTDNSDTPLLTNLVRNIEILSSQSQSNTAALLKIADQISNLNHSTTPDSGIALALTNIAEKLEKLPEKLSATNQTTVLNNCPCDNLKLPLWIAAIVIGLFALSFLVIFSRRKYQIVRVTCSTDPKGHS